MAIRMRRVYWGTLLLLVVGFLVFIFTSNTIERAVAQQRWERRPFEHYTLSVVDRGPMRVSSSFFSYSIADMVVVPNDQRTIRGLFDLLEASRRQTNPCSTEPCVLTVTCQWTAIYHPELGYPEQLVQRCSEHPNWLNAHLWRLPRVIWDACQDGGCRRLIYEQTLEVEMTPLP